MASSPIVEGNHLVTFTITSGGSDIPDTYQVLDIKVIQEINKIAEAEITIRDGSASEQTFEITDADTFVPGAEIEIKLGYENQNDSVFTGIVTKQSIKIDASGSILLITCKDTVVQSTIARKNAVFLSATDSDIIEQIAGNYSFENAVDATTVTHEEVVQFYATDWDFIVNRAEVNGMVVFTDSGTLTVATPGVSETADLTVQYGYDIIELDAEIDATSQYSSVEGNSWDMANQALTNATASEPTVNDQGNLSGSTLGEVLSATNVLNASVPITSDAVQAWADAVLLKSRMSRYRGSITFQGSALAKVNGTITLNGLGDRFNGDAYISGVTHSIDDGQWHTEVKIGMSPEWFSEKANTSGPIASGLLQGVKGLQTGTVKQIYEDTGGEYRVEVQIPVLDDDTATVWARMSTFYASSSVGAFFYPEVGDEVILGFMNEDPRFPIILGSVYSSALTPPVDIADANNYIKTLMTKSQLQLQFDDENIVMTIVTPNNNTIVISDQDQGITITDENSNQIQMNADGITIQSQSSMTIQAADDLTIQGSSVTITADNDLTVSGSSVSASADQSMTISGSSGCDISSSGETNISGSMVNLN
ncbi:type VI secretion system tip protein VgrG [Aquimarina sp. RZ0]|uniref:type VI secretion system tip protein VgrG n=1 Tax=Aquimarina sp. RZ0 TaxID=2607730 RepID=UPI0011F11618|nr:type VI secretion system tip protein VgrG [Aquimarina sp. RZ0]KAA1247753.1 type VI secretion system tip protein VgrG [Aquimarina sp. RZ0]